MSKAKLTLNAGALLRQSLRRYLDNCLYSGYIDKWREAKGFIDSDFYIWGDADKLMMIKKDLERQVS